MGRGFGLICTAVLGALAIAAYSGSPLTAKDSGVEGPALTQTTTTAVDPPGGGIGQGLPADAAPGPGSLPGVTWSAWAEQALRGLGIWAPVGLVVIIVLACVFCVPTVFLALAAGALFGVGWGCVYAWLGAQLGASVAFFFSRHLARNWITRRLVHHPLLAAIEEAISVDGWKVVVLLRLAPGSPFFLLNYLFGLTHVRYRDYLWATAASSLPGTLLFVYLGSLGQMALGGGSYTLWDWILKGSGLLATFTACALVAQRARKVLRRQIPDTSIFPSALSR